MKEQLSDTYKFLYNYIIGELLSQICANNLNYCVKSQEIPYIIGEKFEKYKRAALKNMAGRRLDRHKLASCICGAIIEVRPLAGFRGAVIKKNANEIFALYVGLSIIKFYMMYSLVMPLNFSTEHKKNIIEYLRENISIQFPDFNENICDVQNYEMNLINSLYWTHQICSIAKKECFHYDIWAYSKIFYHIELYNKEYFKKFLQQYIKV